MSKHTLSVLVENKPGVLTRIAGLFSRRGFNIDSLAVGPTEHPDVSRMTVVVDVDELPLEQVTKQLNKLVEVLKVVELAGTASVQREILLVKVSADLHPEDLPLNGRSACKLDDLEHLDQLVELLGDLLERQFVHVDDDRHAGHVGVLGRADREGVDVEPASREQPRDTGQYAGLVLHED